MTCRGSVSALRMVYFLAFRCSLVSCMIPLAMRTRLNGFSVESSEYLTRLSQLRALFGFFVMIFVFKSCVFIMGM